MSFDPADRIPGDIQTPMRELELDAKGKLAEQGHGEPGEPYRRPYIDGDPARYRRPGAQPE